MLVLRKEVSPNTLLIVSVANINTNSFGIGLCCYNFCPVINHPRHSRLRTGFSTLVASFETAGRYFSFRLMEILVSEITNVVYKWNNYI